MKVLHLLASDRFSGAESVVCQIITMFNNDHGIEMAYCSKDGVIGEIAKRRGIQYIGVKCFSIFKLKKVLKSYKPDIIHAHDFRASVIGSLICGKTPIIFHLHNNCPWMKKITIRSLIFKFFSKKAKVVFGVSDSVINEYAFKNSISQKYITIGNPFDRDEIIKKAKASVPLKPYSVGFFGRLAEQKRPLMFVDIIKELSGKDQNITCVMVGDGKLREAVCSKIRESGLSNTIDLTGFSDKPLPIMNSCRVVCMPSAWEGFGLVALEALALGKPVIASPVGGLVNIVNEENGSLCTSVEAFTEKISELLRNDDLYRVKTDAAIKTAKAFSNIDNYKMSLLAIYRKLID